MGLFDPRWVGLLTYKAVRPTGEQIKRLEAFRVSQGMNHEVFSSLVENSAAFMSLATNYFFNLTKKEFPTESMDGWLAMVFAFSIGKMDKLSSVDKQRLADEILSDPNVILKNNGIQGLDDIVRNNIYQLGVYDNAGPEFLRDLQSVDAIMGWKRGKMKPLAEPPTDEMLEFLKTNIPENVKTILYPKYKEIFQRLKVSKDEAKLIDQIAAENGLESHEVFFFVGWINGMWLKLISEHEMKY